MDLYHRFIEATSILYTKVFVGRFFFFDLWSINHMWTGFMLYLILSGLRIKKPFTVILVCLFGYEVFEISLTWFATSIFIPEIIKDQVTDIFIGLTGSFVGFLFLSNYDFLINRFHLVVQNVFIFFISMSFSFYGWSLVMNPFVFMALLVGKQTLSYSSSGSPRPSSQLQYSENPAY